MSLREAAQQALEALELTYSVTTAHCDTQWAAITALRAALGQPEQEPVAWKCACGANLYIDADGKPRSKANGRLTDEVIADLWHQNGTYHHHFARAIERWLRGQD